MPPTSLFLCDAASSTRGLSLHCPSPPKSRLSDPLQMPPSFHSTSFYDVLLSEMLLFTCQFRCLLLCPLVGGQKCVCHHDLPGGGGRGR